MSRLTSDTHPILTKDILEALFKKSISTHLLFIQKKPSVLSSVTGLSYNQILKIKDEILAKYSSTLKRGDRYYLETINHCAIIPTGIEPLNSLLGGGFMTGKIYELCGFEACGKTQICMTTASRICENSCHQVLYIDTKYDFSARRIYKILSNRNKENWFEVMNKIKICHPTSASKLLSDLYLLKVTFSESKEKYLGFKVIIIDSLPILFQSFHNFSESLSILNDIASLMNFLAHEYNLVILITNFVTTWTKENTLGENEDEDANNILKVELPALGKYWSHVPNTRIMIKRKGCADDYYLTILKSDDKPVGQSAKITITDQGVQ